MRKSECIGLIWPDFRGLCDFFHFSRRRVNGYYRWANLDKYISKISENVLTHVLGWMSHCVCVFIITKINLNRLVHKTLLVYAVLTQKYIKIYVFGIFSSFWKFTHYWVFTHKRDGAIVDIDCICFLVDLDEIRLILKFLKALTSR